MLDALTLEAPYKPHPSQCSLEFDDGGSDRCTEIYDLACRGELPPEWVTQAEAIAYYGHRTEAGDHHDLFSKMLQALHTVASSTRMKCRGFTDPDAYARAVMFHRVQRGRQRVAEGSHRKTFARAMDPEVMAESVAQPDAPTPGPDPDQFWPALENVLSRAQFQCMQLRYSQSMSVIEIAAEQGTSRGTINQRLIDAEWNLMRRGFWGMAPAMKLR